MSNGKGLKIIQQILAEAQVKERHEDAMTKRKLAKPDRADGSKIRRYVRTPENDARFKAGETYLDKETGRIKWVPKGVDPNLK